MAYVRLTPDRAHASFYPQFVAARPLVLVDGVPTELGDDQFAQIADVALSGNYADLTTKPPIIVGTGSPEGVIDADVGTLYLRTDGGVGTTAYIKESGTGNTGWNAVTDPPATQAEMEAGTESAIRAMSPLNVAQAIAALGSGGALPVSLIIPDTIHAGSIVDITISDYDSASTYSVSAANGAATISGDTIIYTAPGTAGTDTLTVTINGVSRNVTLSIADGLPLIGTPGTQGFGVGKCPASALPSGFTCLSGYDDPSSSNYGNYQTANGSIMVFIPRFYYRIGSPSSPNYSTYGANAIDIAGVDTFATETEANAAGYAMPRAFIDGGQTLEGFFIDKYLASKDGTTTCKSIANADPISLTTSSNYNPSSTMTGCSGLLADAIVLSRARGAGFHCASIFQYAALALLSLAHGQAATSTTHCAWYDANGVTNFPKGCNNNALSDENDSSVTYAASYSSKPKTRATADFAKTTHNGQESGVADLNGSMWQVVIGITTPGTSATDSAQIANGDAYVLKTSVSLADLTAGWNGVNDVWGDANNLATKYDLVSGLLPWDSTVGWIYFGNGANQVFDGSANGTGWLRTNCGIQMSNDSMSNYGTNLFGADGCYRYNRANLFLLASGPWNSYTTAGVFCRSWGTHRSNKGYYYGFRCGFPVFGS